MSSFSVGLFVVPYCCCLGCYNVWQSLRKEEDLWRMLEFNEIAKWKWNWQTYKNLHVVYALCKTKQNKTKKENAAFIHISTEILASQPVNQPTISASFSHILLHITKNSVVCIWSGGWRRVWEQQRNLVCGHKDSCIAHICYDISKFTKWRKKHKLLFVNVAIAW